MTRLQHVACSVILACAAFAAQAQSNNATTSATTNTTSATTATATKTLATQAKAAGPVTTSSGAVGPAANSTGQQAADAFIAAKTACHKGDANLRDACLKDVDILYKRSLITSKR